MQVLSLNKNQIVALGSFLVQAVDKFPALKHLSLMGNPCCPSEVFGASRQDYERCVAPLRLVGTPRFSQVLCILLDALQRRTRTCARARIGVPKQPLRGLIAGGSLTNATSLGAHVFRQVF
jgi:hypothetical protein